MTGLIQLVLRHEKTMKNADGEKLDQPTPEGLAKAYQRGIDYRAEYPDHLFVGAHSEKHRAYDACAAFLMGADAVPVESHIATEPALNSIKMKPEDRAVIRNMTDKEAQMRLLLTDYAHLFEEVGQTIADYVVKEAMSETAGTSKLTVNVTHGPVIDAAYLTLLGVPVNYENAQKHTGLFNEGEGFKVTTENIKGVWAVHLENLVSGADYTIRLDVKS